MSEETRRDTAVKRDGADFYPVFAKLRGATINFVMSLGPSARMEHVGSHWTDFHEI